MRVEVKKKWSFVEKALEWGKYYLWMGDGSDKVDQEWSHELITPSNKVGSIKGLRMVFRRIFIELDGKPHEWKKKN